MFIKTKLINLIKDYNIILLFNKEIMQLIN